KRHYKYNYSQHIVPHHRKRIIYLDFREPAGFTWADLRITGGKKRMKDILLPAEEVDDRYTLSPKLWTYLKNYAAKHKAAGNGFGYGLVTKDSVARTMSTSYYKDGSEILYT